MKCSCFLRYSQQKLYFSECKSLTAYFNTVHLIIHVNQNTSMFFKSLIRSIIPPPEGADEYNLRCAHP